MGPPTFPAAILDCWRVAIGSLAWVPRFAGKFCTKGKLFATEGVVMAFTKKVGRPGPVGLFPPTATGMKAEAPTPAVTGVNAEAPPHNCSCACATSGGNGVVG